MNQPRILTGHRPTGLRHIGHLVETLETWAQVQDSHECFFLVADLYNGTAQAQRIAHETCSEVRELTVLAQTTTARGG